MSKNMWITEREINKQGQTFCEATRFLSLPLAMIKIQNDSPGQYNHPSVMN